MKVSRVSEMRELDRTAMTRYGIREELLMENAGEAVYFLMDQVVEIRGRTFAILCGGGNNGGDGLVIARKLHAAGARVKVFLLADPAKFGGAAALNYEIVTRLPIELCRVTAAQDLRRDVMHADGLVDAIFGTGLMRDVEGFYAEVIALMNTSGKPVFSVDIPSGVNGDTGRVMGTAVDADYTVTFGLPKIGNMLYPGFQLGGELYVTHISFPPEMYADLPIAVNVPPELPPRDREGHKGSFGEVLFIAGAASYYGAPYFAAASFLKGGGGYARLAAPRAVIPYIAAKGSEIVFMPMAATGAGSLALTNKAALLDIAARMDMVVLGPGISLDPETQSLARELAAAVPVPLLVDGDGLTAVAQDLELVRRRTAPTILTPHPGEMARLTGRTVREVDAERIDVLIRTAGELQATIVFKGAHSLIGTPDGRVFINLSGNPGMGTAGAGDVLTGTVAAMHGLGLPVEEAVRKGVFVHGLAGDMAAEAKGEDGITAQDILNYLPLAVKRDREAYAEITAEYGGPTVI